MKCSQENCSTPACWSYVWPGKAKRQFACDHCMTLAKKIASTMGFALGDPMMIDEDGNRRVFDDDT